MFNKITSMSLPDRYHKGNRALTYILYKKSIYNQSRCPADSYMFNNRNSRKRCRACSKLTIKTLE